MIKKRTQNFSRKLGITLCVMLLSILGWGYAKEGGQGHTRDILLTTKLAKGMELSGKDHERVQAMVHNYETKNSGVFTHLDGDGLAVFNFVVAELDRRGMPLEIAFVPLVESGYRPNARNGQHIGLWQLSPVAAKTFGIHVSEKSDGRLNLMRATAGALDYLEYLNKRFDGDWLLTLAAYNAGEGRVLRSMKKNRLAGKSDDYWSLELPPITRAYIPRVLALSKLALKKKQLAVPVAKIPELVQVKSQNKAGLLGSAQKQGFGERTLNYFNPSDIYNKEGASVVILTKDALSVVNSNFYAL